MESQEEGERKRKQVDVERNASYRAEHIFSEHIHS